MELEESNVSKSFDSSSQKLESPSNLVDNTNEARGSFLTTDEPNDGKVRPDVVKIILIILPFTFLFSLLQLFLLGWVTQIVLAAVCDWIGC